MKNSYPIVLMPEGKRVVVYIPDFNINTQGNDLTDAIEMARDAIGIIGIDMQDENEPIPTPSDIKEITTDNENNIVTLVDVDFSEYRKKMK